MTFWAWVAEENVGIWIWLIGGMLLAVIVILHCRIAALHMAMREIGEELAEKLETDTNTPITTGSRDGAIRELAENVNGWLRTLRDKRHRYEQGNRALQEAVTNVSHDIRTPLTAICGYLELLEQEEKSETAERYLAVIRNRTAELKKLTEELFVYATVVPADIATEVKCDEGVINGAGTVDAKALHGTRVFGQDENYEDVEIGEALEESILAYYGALQERQITPEVFTPDTKIVRRLNPKALSRIFANVLDNAVKYSDGDLQIRLSEDGEITFSNHAANLDEIQVGRLFDRFYTVENAAQATGIGLSIARILTEQMGGRIAAQYADGVLTIRVNLCA